MSVAFDEHDAALYLVHRQRLLKTIEEEVASTGSLLSSAGSAGLTANAATWQISEYLLSARKRDTVVFQTLEELGSAIFIDIWEHLDTDPELQQLLDEYLFEHRPLLDSMTEKFNRISDSRRKELEAHRDDLVRRYGSYEDDADGIRDILPFASDKEDRVELSHADVGDLLQDLANDDNLTDDEAAYVWHWFALGKSGFGLAGFNAKHDVKFDGRQLPYFVSPDGSPKEVRNDDIIGESNTSAHTVIHFADGYHVPLADASSAEASATVDDHESGLTDRLDWDLENDGDKVASKRTAHVLRAYKQTNNFSVFASSWNDAFVGRPESQQVPNPHVPTGTTTTTTQPADAPQEDASPVSPTTNTPDSPPAGTTTTTTANSPPPSSTTKEPWERYPPAPDTTRSTNQ